MKKILAVMAVIIFWTSSVFATQAGYEAKKYELEKLQKKKQQVRVYYQNQIDAIRNEQKALKATELAQLRDEQAFKLNVLDGEIAKARQAMLAEIDDVTIIGV